MIKQFLLFSFLVFSLFCCKNDPCFKGSGSTTTERRELPQGISTVELNDNVNLTIHRSSDSYMNVTGGKNLLDFIETTTSGGSLKISNKNSCSFLRGFDQDITVDLYIDSLENLIYKGNGDIKASDTLRNTSFFFSAESAAGDVTLIVKTKDLADFYVEGSYIDLRISGSTEKLNLQNGGSTWFRGDQMHCSEATINTKSTGDCIVHADSILNCTVSNIGNIQYYGNPTVNLLSITGKGRVFRGK